MPSLVATCAARWWQTVLRHADAAVTDPAPVHIHRFRTHLRRLRSLERHLRGELPAPEAVQVRTTLRQVALRTGRLRDLDVLCERRESWLEALPAELRDGGQEVWRELGRERARARELVAGYLAGDHFRGQRLATGRILPELFADPDGRLDAALRASVVRHHRRLARAARKHEAATPAARWHRLRIRAKKLRYGLEVCPASDARDALLAEVKTLQGHLGRFNDLAVQRLLLSQLADDAWSPAAHRAVGAWLLWLHEAETALRPELPAALAPFAGKRSGRLAAAAAAA